MTPEKKNEMREALKQRPVKRGHKCWLPDCGHATVDDLARLMGVGRSYVRTWFKPGGRHYDDAVLVGECIVSFERKETA